MPLTTGVSSARHASAMPSIASCSCQNTSGFSGLPKLRQLVTASGVAPTATTLRAASHTAMAAPTRGSSTANRALPSVARAMAPDVPRTRTSAASPPGGITVSSPTWWS